MKKHKNLICVIFSVLLLASASGCTGGGGSAASGVDVKGKKIGYVPPS